MFAQYYLGPKEIHLFLVTITCIKYFVNGCLIFKDGSLQNLY